jgi:thiamine-phosphate pyrophosphorylase
LPHVPNTPVVCYVTDQKSLNSPNSAASVREHIQNAMHAGVDWVQIREKDLPARELLALVRDSLHYADSSGAEKRRGREGDHASWVTRVVVNDRVDVALAAGAWGVHLGGDSLGVREVVEWCRRGNAPPEFSIGVSCHSVKEAKEAESAGASYIFFGPVFDTPSKRSFGAPQGIERLTEICAAQRVPVLAIGGVDENNARECLNAGARGIAAIRMFQVRANERELKNAVHRIHAQVQPGFDQHEPGRGAT